MKHINYRIKTKRVSALLAIILLCMCGSGYGFDFNVRSILTQEDPRASFEVFMRAYLHNLQAAYDEEEAAEKRFWYKINNSETRYDVVKTASLVAPYEGTITFSYSMGIINDDESTSKQTQAIKFGYRDGKWDPTVMIDEDGKTWVFNMWGSCHDKAYERTKQ